MYQKYVPRLVDHHHNCSRVGSMKSSIYTFNPISTLTLHRTISRYIHVTYNTTTIIHWFIELKLIHYSSFIIHYSLLSLELSSNSLLESLSLLLSLLLWVLQLSLLRLDITVSEPWRVVLLAVVLECIILAINYS